MPAFPARGSTIVLTFAADFRNKSHAWMLEQRVEWARYSSKSHNPTAPREMSQG
jgi:hypothetical protein